MEKRGGKRALATMVRRRRAGRRNGDRDVELIRSSLRLSDVSSGYDVIVIGAGAAGMSAALFSAIRGARTLLVEKTGYVGGTSALSAGSIWIPNTRHHASSALTADTSANAERYLQADRRQQVQTPPCAQSFPGKGRSRSGRSSGKTFRGQASGLCKASRLSLGIEGAVLAGRVAMRAVAVRIGAAAWRRVRSRSAPPLPRVHADLAG